MFTTQHSNEIKILGISSSKSGDDLTISEHFTAFIDWILWEKVLTTQESDQYVSGCHQ